MIPWLEHPAAFPPVEQALADPPGLLAAGGALTPDWLLAAYRRGIFPWFSAGEPILWWSLDPRLVLEPRHIKISRSLARTLRQQRFEVRLDTAFAAVMAGCAAPRDPGGGTWITTDMQAAYLRMHDLGYAHSVESWQDGTLQGGLYGLALGRVFFGESMFSRASDASKVALAHLARYLEAQGFAVIDCQMTTRHLQSLGAREVPRQAFCEALDTLTRQHAAPARWPADGARGLFQATGR